MKSVHFGASGFTPLLASDGLFTKGYLDLLTHPSSDSVADFVNDLRGFVTRADALPRTDIRTRIRARLEVMLGAGGEADITAAFAAFPTNRRVRSGRGQASHAGDRANDSQRETHATTAWSAGASSA